jgi:hypothetical protein
MHEYCEYFEGYQISDIENKLIELASSDNRKLEQWSDKIYKYANDTFTLEKYTNNIRNCLKNILNDSAAFLK